ncbi:MAG: chemotaxis response regulator protein-glutamate methylesterase [Paracoccus denitrificans]|nr:MAG: chemotaxis response regulator protein-glutamate methylesterase [Paracoccus denitrificans]PZO83482.1 MAG: chemotaxis response regulator protein-glutamate methylesterase [Paracoccus denitrificans]
MSLPSRAPPPPRYLRRIRVLIIDDSLTMRRLIRMALQVDPRIEIVGEARDGRHARDQITALRPDVLTMDVEMPGESGLSLLEWVMRDAPRPVVMVSAVTQAGSAAAVEALSLGAVECVPKPSADQRQPDLVPILRAVLAASLARVARRDRPMEARRVPVGAKGFIWNGKYVVMGASTGGVDALEKVLAALPANCPPIVITQHMPAAFTASFVQRLNARLPFRVALASSGAPLLPGQVLVAPGGDSHLSIATPAKPVCLLTDGPPRNGHRPSVDVLFSSAAALRDRAIGVLLTGMGRDGAEGMLAMRRNGALCLAQDRRSSVVWGMPRVAYEMGAVDRLVPLSCMGTEILNGASRTARCVQSGGAVERRAPP